MTETKEPDFSRLGKRQIEALGNVAFGGTGVGVRPSMLKALAAKGLIEREMETGHDALGPYQWPTWFMPLPVHIAFCAFCESLPDGNAGDDQG